MDELSGALLLLLTFIAYDKIPCKTSRFLIVFSWVLMIAGNILPDELCDKIEWIHKKADWDDPFIEAEDDLMRGIDSNF